jgi:FkbM family methyltransferase
MRNIISALFRNICYPIVSFPLLYFPGMVLVRLSRMIRTWYYTPSAPVEMKVVRLAGGPKMNVDRNSYMGGSIYWTGFHHLQELLYLDKRLKPNMVFVDVGANQGEFALFAAHKARKGKVLAFEPVTKNRNLLLENIRLNAFSNLEVFPFGLSDQKGSLPVYTSLATEVFHGHHEGLSTLYPSEIRNVQEELISLEVFDNCFQGTPPHVDFVKIDVEGAELFVLRGMKAMLERDKPELLIEINEETFNSAGYATDDVVQLLSGYGYVPYKLKRGNVVRIGFSEMSAWGNYIFRAGT